MERDRGRGRQTDLVRGARAGEAWALREIWQRHGATVNGYLRARGADEPDDLTSDVFVGVFERLHRFDGDEEQLRAFVFTVAHHRLVDSLRKSARRPAVTSYDADGDSRRAPSAEEQVIENLSAQRVQELLQELTAEQRDVILMRVLGELSIEETATALGKRVGAVKALQHRALAALKKILDQPVSL
jgi:RNA polymerase sigma-70 factor (ECF subfamily)